MKMKNRMRKHTLKFVSVFLAVFLWVYVLNSEKVKFEKTVQLEYIMPQDLIFSSKPPTDVIFMIEGPRAFVKSVAEKEEKLIIDVNRLNPRRLLNFPVDILPTQLNLPFGMVVERVLPRKLQLKMEKKASKIVPVKAVFTGQLPEEFALARSELSPSEVEVFGPVSVITKLKEVSTKNIELESLIGQSSVPVEIRLNDERLGLEPGVELKFNYEFKARANHVLRDVPIRFLTQNKKIDAKVRAVDLKLLVPEKVKNRSNISSSVQVWADIPGHAQGRLEVPLKVIVPSGIHVLEVTPKTIIVNVQ